MVGSQVRPERSGMIDDRVLPPTRPPTIANTDGQAGVSITHGLDTTHCPPSHMLTKATVTVLIMVERRRMSPPTAGNSSEDQRREAPSLPPMFLARLCLHSLSMDHVRYKVVIQMKSSIKSVSQISPQTDYGYI